MSEDNQVVVFLPEQPVQTYKYDFEQDILIKNEVDSVVIKRTHANALWRSLAYKEGDYKPLANY
ncbi:hypothetical protein [Shewanella sp. 10N.286.48.A6]|uniref:hypothetical protein n=1 Tax=Shewanella sp. 10N.286.48.A6 TaxID=1880833 RepID=UPI000C81B43B|nr:hypothetical protein [Shewanella sp. 10N.286.48.A6]PMI03272.1 hypothetical protein BCU55_01110 [Shewanella sp. 10N.286.48.A6]